jgi:energy-coupling factor transporter transmembrane protein EcfT
MHNILTDIGANIGISFSIIILSIIGLMLLWEDGLRNLVVFSTVLALIVLAMFNDSIRIYLSFVLMVYAGFALIYMNKRKWSISIIKKTTLLLIICSILFSTLVYTTKIIRSEPGSDYLNALNFINDQALDSEAILANPDNGYFIEYYSNRSVLLDNYNKYYDKSRLNAFDTLLSSRNLERTEKLLNEYEIKYIIVDSGLEQSLKEHEGLLFLIETSKKFTTIYKNTDVEIYMYTG